MRNKVKFGLKNAHFVPMNSDGTYDENVYALPGAVSISLEAEGDSSSFAADDDPDFFTMYVNNGYSGSLEFTLLNENYLTKVLGQTKDANGVITENANDVSKPFAFMFEIDGDAEKRRVVFYKCTTSRPSVEAKTKDKETDPQTEKVDIKASQDASGRIKSIVHTGDEAYATFFESVYGTTI